jgi:hypothetical protein
LKSTPLDGRSIASSVSERPTPNYWSGHAGAAGDYHFEVRLLNGFWEWEVFRVNEDSVGRGKALTLESAKTQAVICSGTAQDDWKDGAPVSV